MEEEAIRQRPFEPRPVSEGGIAKWSLNKQTWRFFTTQHGDFTCKNMVSFH
jgi:hypothetical protein